MYRSSNRRVSRIKMVARRSRICRELAHGDAGCHWTDTVLVTVRCCFGWTPFAQSVHLKITPTMWKTAVYGLGRLRLAGRAEVAAAAGHSAGCSIVRDPLGFCITLLSARLMLWMWCCCSLADSACLVFQLRLKMRRSWLDSSRPFPRGGMFG